MKLTFFSDTHSKHHDVLHFPGGYAQFWSLEHPHTPGYAKKYGIPEENIRNADFIEIATVKDKTDFITRKAPGIGNNTGGGIEVVVKKDGISIGSHTSLD